VRCRVGERMISAWVVPTVKQQDNDREHTSRLFKGYLT
jgi:hypothetical protein